MLVNSGIERCRTLQITKSVSGNNLPNYPKTYSIIAAFTINQNSYGVLSEIEFRELSDGDYNIRLADFKDYVSASEDNVDIDEVTEVGYEASRENTTACPIGGL